MTRTGTVTAAVAKRRKSIYSLIESQKSQISRALPRHLDADRLARVAFTVVRTNPQLLDASQESLLGALMTCAQLGLEPGPLGHAYLVPFYNKGTRQAEVVFIPGYRGLIELARRSGQVRSIAGRVVRAGDHFDWGYALDADHLEHHPHIDSKGEVTHAYAIARLTDGGADFDVMTKAEVDKVRARSKAAESGPWVTDYEEMAKKTVIKRLCKRLPMSVELSQALAQDERVRTEIDPDDLDVTPEVDEDVIDGEVAPEPPADRDGGDGEREPGV